MGLSLQGVIRYVLNLEHAWRNLLVDLMPLDHLFD